MQAIESAELSLAAFKERAGFPSARRWIRKPRRDIADALMTAFWANGISSECGDEDHKALERRFAPGSKCCDPDDPVYTNLWLGYLRGQHVPTTILPMVSQMLPEANACLESPLWPLLTAESLNSKQLHNLMWHLDRETFELVWRDARRLGGYQLAVKLERRVSLDALAAEILMLRFSALRGEALAAFYWGKYIWRMMLLLGPSFVEGGIAQALAELLEERIMPMATVRGERFGFPSGSFNSLVWQYVATIYQVLRLPAGTPDDRLPATGQGILDGAFGSTYRWMFNPKRLTTTGGPPTTWLCADSAPELISMNSVAACLTCSRSERL